MSIWASLGLVMANLAIPLLLLFFSEGTYITPPTDRATFIERADRAKRKWRWLKK